MKRIKVTPTRKRCLQNPSPIRVNGYNNKYHRTIKMKPNDVKVSTYIEFDAEKNYKYFTFKFDDHTKYKIFWNSGHS